MILEVLAQLDGAGFQAVLVGGGVRDLLLGRSPADFDIATSATPADVQRIFPRTIPTGVQHGTVTVLHRGKPVEVTTFRSEGAYLDGRHPQTVEFHGDIRADLSRRDFTINAIAWHPRDGLIDFFDGLGDLDRKVVRAVGVPKERFLEDGLRTIRAVRFATVLNFHLDPATENAIPEALGNFAKVSRERILAEFRRILLAPHAALGVQRLVQTGLLEVFLPWARGAPYAGLDALPQDFCLRLALLLFTARDLQEEQLRELKLPRAEIRETLALLAAFPLPSPTASPGVLRRYLARIGAARRQAVLALGAAAGVAPEGLAEALEAAAAPPAIFSLQELAISGDEVQALLGGQPSRRVGQALQQLLEQVLETPASNTHDTLRTLLAQWVEREER